MTTMMVIVAMKIIMTMYYSDNENYYYDVENDDGDNDDLDESGSQGEEVRVASVKEPSARHLHHHQYQDEGGRWL